MNLQNSARNNLHKRFTIFSHLPEDMQTSPDCRLSGQEQRYPSGLRRQRCEQLPLKEEQG